jgi:hypothetical protein
MCGTRIRRAWNFRRELKGPVSILSRLLHWKNECAVGSGARRSNGIHEPCLFGLEADRKHQWYSTEKQVTVWEYESAFIKDHPTMKPWPT